MDGKQVEITDAAGDRPKTGEEGAFSLPEGDFAHGKLGIIVSFALLFP